MQREVIHIVLFRWRSDASEARVEAAYNALRGLSAEIPGIVEIACGANFTDRSKGFQSGLVVRFTDRAALDAYLPHPAHRRVVEEFINPIREDSLALDFEV